MKYVFYPVNRDLETSMNRKAFSMKHQIEMNNKEDLLKEIGMLYHSQKPAEIINLNDVDVVVVYNPFDLKFNIDGKMRNGRVEVGCMITYSDSDDIDFKLDQILTKFISDRFH